MMNGQVRMPAPTNIILADQQKRVVVGRQPPVDRTKWINIESGNSQIVGYLGVIQRKQPSLDVDRLFVSRLGFNLLVVVIFALFILVFILESDIVLNDVPDTVPFI